MNAIAGAYPSVLGISAILAALVGVAGALASVREVVLRRKAEEHFRALLDKDERYQHHMIGRLQETFLDPENPSIPAEWYVDLMWIFNYSLDELDEADKKRITEALYQPSVRGRANYIRNLIRHTARIYKERRRGDEPGESWF